MVYEFNRAGKGSWLACLGHGFKGSSDPPQSWRIKILKNYKELKVWQQSYKLV